MPTNPRTPPDTPPGQLRQALRPNLEDALGIKGVFVMPPDAAVVIRQDYDLAAAVDEALAALLGVLDANAPANLKAALANLRTQIGV